MENILFYAPDIRQLVENVNIGPQAEVKELINSFNESYVQQSNHVDRYYRLQAPTKPLGITKKFYWKPGAYDTLKDILWRQSEMHKKANSLSKVISRAKDATNWRYRNILNDIKSIEDMLIRFRQDGLVQQDNTDDAVEAWEVLKHHFIEQFQACNGRFTVYVEEQMTTNDLEVSRLTDYMINIVYEYNDITINYKHAESEESLAGIFLPGEGHLTVKMSLTRLINELIRAKMDINNFSSNNVTSRRYNSNKWFYDIGGNYETFENLEHPYISRDRQGYNGNHYHDDFKYVCVGNLEEEVRGCIKSLDFISLGVFFDRLMIHYDTNTGPLNRIGMCYHGQPDFLEGADEYYKINPPKESTNCRYWEFLEDDEPEYIQEESYCAKFCTLKKTCTAYKAVSRTLTKEDLERRALEQATINAANRRVQ